MAEIKAALHVHSTWSDGELSLREVRDLFLADGCRVVAMAEHADAFDEHSLRAFVEECTALSDHRIHFVPGLEYGCQRRMHVVGYGMSALFPSDDPVEVIRFIAAHGGVSVIAHPAPEHLDWIPAFGVLPDGIEAGNTKYDGAAAPRPAVFALIRSLQVRRPGLRAFYGQDFHWRHQFRGLFNELAVPDDSTASILEALRAGVFRGLCGTLSLPSDGDVPAALLYQFGARNARSQWVRRLVRRLKKLAGPVGRALPPGVKSRLRRFL